MRKFDYKNKHNRVAGVLVAVVCSVVVSACIPATTGGAEGIGFREARFQELSAMKSYRACVDDATDRSTQARQKNHPSGYLAAARLLEKCEAGLGPEAKAIATEERMRAYALGIVNYLKAGDSAAARKNLEIFKQTFGEYDLGLPGGGSFVDTVEVLTGGKSEAHPFESAMLDVNEDLRREVQRIRFWKRN